MCGICGFTGEIVDRSTVITKMTDVITHRGPDSSGVFEGDGVTMGFRRLSIIDISSTGDQPIYNEDESISIELHIIVENGVNIPAVCRSIMNEVRYVVNKNTGAEVRAVDVFVDSMIL